MKQQANGVASLTSFLFSGSCCSALERVKHCPTLLLTTQQSLLVSSRAAQIPLPVPSISRTLSCYKPQLHPTLLSHLLGFKNSLLPLQISTLVSKPFIS